MHLQCKGTCFGMHAAFKAESAVSGRNPADLMPEAWQGMWSSLYRWLLLYEAEGCTVQGGAEQPRMQLSQAWLLLCMGCPEVSAECRPGTKWVGEDPRPQLSWYLIR